MQDRSFSTVGFAHQHEAVADNHHLVDLNDFLQKRLCRL